MILHSVKKQVELHFSCTAVSSEDSSATDLLMLQTQYKIVHVCTGTYMYTVYAMGVVHNLTYIHIFTRIEKMQPLSVGKVLYHHSRQKEHLKFKIRIRPDL